MERGPVDIVALAFPADVAAEEMAWCLRAPVEDGHVAIVDLVFLLRDEQGALVALDVEHQLFPASGLAGLPLDPHTLLSDEDLVTIASSLDAGQQAMVAALEHVWARSAVERVESLGAELALFAHVPELVVDSAYEADVPA